MAGDTRDLFIRTIVTGDIEANAKLARLEATGNRVSKSVSSISLMQGIQTGLMIWDRLESVIHKVGDGFERIVKLGHSSTAGSRGLMFAIGPGQLAEVQDYVGQLTLMANVMDDKLVAALDKVQSKTGANAAELKLAARAIVGLAGDTKNYDAAAQKVIKTMNFSSRELKQYGIELDENATGHERLAALVKATNAEFEKQIAKANNATDQFSIFHTQLENVVEDIGALIDQSPPVVTALKEINEVVAGIVGNLGEWIKANPVLIEQLGQGLAVTLLQTAKAAIGLAQGMNYIGEAWTYIRPYAVSPGPHGLATTSKRLGEIDARMQGHQMMEEVLRQAQDSLDSSMIRIANGDYVTPGASGLGVPGFDGGIPGGGAPKAERYQYPYGFSPWEDMAAVPKSLGFSVAQAKYREGMASFLNTLGLVDASDWGWADHNKILDGGSAAGKIGGLNSLVKFRERVGNMGGLGGAATDIATAFSIRNGQARLGNKMLGIEETARMLNGGLNFNRRSQGHMDNRLGYLQAAMNGDLSGLGGMIGGVYGPGGAMLGTLAGGLVKKAWGGIEDLFGGGGKKPEVVAGKVQVYDEQVHQALEAGLAELLNATQGLLARGRGAGVDSALSHVRLQRERAGSPIGRHAGRLA